MGALTVFNEGEAKLRAGDFQGALGAYLRVVRGAPMYWRARFRIADTLLNLKAPQQALGIYSSLAWHCIKNGQPLEALVCIKMAALLDPSQIDAVEILAQMYSGDSDRTDPDKPPNPAIQISDKLEAGDLGGLSGDALIAAAAAEAANTDNIAQYPDRFPAIPLFSFLDEDAFVSVLGKLQLRRYADGQPVITEGETGDSFFMLAAGDVEVTKQLPTKKLSLARLHPGAVFGEMALISKEPRTATVSALDDCELLELKRSDLEDEAHRLHSVTKALREFTHDRFLANLTATSSVFKPFPKSIRTEIIKKFKDFPVDPGDELIAEGEEGQGLFLIMKGQVDVTKNDGGAQVSLARLKEGDVFGEISLLTEQQTIATCTAVVRGELLFLPKKDFTSTMLRHPEMKDVLADITDRRLAATKELMDPEEYELIEDDELIML